GKDDAIDQGIDGRVLDARTVARTGTVGGVRSEEIALLVARRQRLSPYGRGDVEVETAQAILVLHAVDGADRHGYAEPLEVGLVEQHTSLIALFHGQELNADGFASRIDQLAVADFEPRLLEKTRGLPQIVARRFRAAADRIAVRRRKQFGRHLVAQR